MSSRRLLVAPLTLVLLAGCDTIYPQSGSPDPGFGEAVKYNAAIQTIDPAPVYDENGSQPGDSGAKGAAAVKRYRTDAVKPVETISTSSGSGPR
ncbi:MAG TPA: hypothetical protein VFK50_04545 [Sphingomicrobium sp.]|nr:hypothetical protein [Sphingomicrobium sp.]